MPKKAKELTALEVSRLKAPGFVSVGAPAGLALQITPALIRSWVLRVKVGDRRRDIGLGAYPAVTLAEARKKALETREAIAQGIDPIAQRRAAKSALIAARAKEMTFEKAAEALFAAMKPKWKNAKHAAQWINTLRDYANPIMGKVDVALIDTPLVLRVLEPIWNEKPETARRVRQRIAAVLDSAKARNLRTGDNPAQWSGHLDKILSNPDKRVVKHHEAVPVVEMPGFYADLTLREGMGARALEFIVLTAARSNEARGATWSEFDLNSGIWTVPKERMKMGKEHRVPLPARAIKLLRALPRLEGSDFVFFAARGGQLSDQGVSTVMRRMGRSETVHGFRSSFRVWVGDHTSFPGELAEVALAHKLDKVEAAYNRSDALERRRKMMEAWAKYCTTPRLNEADKVVTMHNRKKA